MKTYTGAITFYQSLTNNVETANTTLGADLINSFIRKYCVSNGGKWWFLEKVTTQSTVASQQAYTIPQSTRKIVDLYVTVGTTVYSPIAVEDPALWKRILQSQLGTSDRAEFYYRQGSQVLLAPTPGSSGNTITIRTRREVVDLRNADYTTGTVSATLASTGIVGSGTTFTSAMVGRYINLTSGDGQWYEISAFTDTTHITLNAPYEGATVSGSSFTLGESSILPISYHEMPIYDAAAVYWATEDSNRSRMFKEIADGLYEGMLTEAGEKTEGAYMLPVDNLVFRDPNVPEPTVNTSSFT